MQRGQALRIVRVQVGAGGKQARGEFRQAERGRQHQHGDLARQALFEPCAGVQQAFHDLQLAHADRRRQRGGTGVRGERGIRAARQQQFDQGAMAAAGRAQQGAAALAVHRVHRQPQVQQATHRLGIADDRRGRDIGGLQGAPGQAPTAPVQPRGEVATPGRQREAEGRLPVRRTTVACRARGHEALQRLLAPQRGRVVERGHATPIASIQVDAESEQAFEQPRPAQAYREHQRRFAGSGCAEWIRPALHQLEREGLRARSLRGRACRQEGRQSAATGR